jgi:uncharacterized protein (TIGR03663 family)
MSRAAFGVAFTAALALGLWLRLADPAARPMHHDEANQAIRVGALLEAGEYRYDPQDHHGPTLYYLTLPFAWARGQWTMAALDERTLRMLPAIAGAGLLLCFLGILASRAGPQAPVGITRLAVIVAAALAAISPILTYYSRFFIQESLLLFFGMGAVVALGRYVLRPAMTPAIAAGALAGFALATKETALILLPVASLSCVMAARVTRLLPATGASVRHALAALGAALLPILLFYSAFLTHPEGLRDVARAIPIYLERGIDPAAHTQPFFYYLRMLGWSSSEGLVWTELLVLILATIGCAVALAPRARSFWPLYICLYSIGTLLIFSALRYKTPWNALPFYGGLVLMAGFGAATLFARARHRVLQVLLVVVLAAAGWQLAAQSVRASFRYAADPRNPYAYAHTTTDFARLPARLYNLAEHHPDGRDMYVKVVARPFEQWPFPWYARRLTRVGYWGTAADASPLDDAPVLVVSMDQVDDVEAVLGERYISEFYGLRPGVLLALYIERGLWERFLASRR